MNILKILVNPRVVSAVISALGAIIAVSACGCKMFLGEMTVKDFSVEVLTTNCVSEVIR